MREAIVDMPYHGKVKLRCKHFVHRREKTSFDLVVSEEATKAGSGRGIAPFPHVEKPQTPQPRPGALPEVRVRVGEDWVTYRFRFRASAGLETQLVLRFDGNGEIYASIDLMNARTTPGSN